MKDVHHEPDGLQGRTAPSAPSASLRWDAPAEVGAWLEALEAVVLDGLAAGRDAAQRPKWRVLSRREAQRRIRNAHRRVRALLLGAGLRAPAAAPAATEEGGAHG
jgi:hypothetical protein